MKNAPLKSHQQEHKLKIIKNKLKENSRAKKIYINTLTPNFTYLNSNNTETSPVNKVKY